MPEIRDWRWGARRPADGAVKMNQVLPMVYVMGLADTAWLLAARWIGLALIEGRRLQLATASSSVLGYEYDHDPTDEVIHAWNDSVTAAASAL